MLIWNYWFPLVCNKSEYSDRRDSDFDATIPIELSTTCRLPERARRRPRAARGPPAARASPRSPVPRAPPFLVPPWRGRSASAARRKPVSGRRKPVSTLFTRTQLLIVARLAEFWTDDRASNTLRARLYYAFCFASLARAVHHPHITQTPAFPSLFRVFRRQCQLCLAGSKALDLSL